MRLQSCVFRLIARGCHLRHTARTLHGQVNVRVSRGANNCHVPRQGSAAFKKTQCETIWSLAVLAYQANCFFLQLGPQQLHSESSTQSHQLKTSNEIVQYVMPVCRQGCADRERRPASRIGKGAGHTSPAQDVNRLQP